MNYISLSVVRNEEKSIANMINSILAQTIEAEKIIVVNDGSTDATGTILQRLQEEHLNKIIIVTRKDRGYSALGKQDMANVYNDGYKIAFKYEWDFVLICSADAIFPNNYIKQLFRKVHDKTGVISGLGKNCFRGKDYPMGNGRIIRRILLEKLEKKYPVNCYWESSVLGIARMLNYETKHYPDIVFIETRKQGSGHKCDYIGWGFGARDGGYYFFWFFISILKEIFEGKIGIAVKRFVGYMARKKNNAFYAKFNTQYQKKRFISSLQKYRFTSIYYFLKKIKGGN